MKADDVSKSALAAASPMASRKFPAAAHNRVKFEQSNDKEEIEKAMKLLAQQIDDGTIEDSEGAAHFAGRKHTRCVVWYGMVLWLEVVTKVIYPTIVLCILSYLWSLRSVTHVNNTPITAS